ncbi:MAG: hypothetical protein RLZZ338_1995 [Cyanobacteriota bacterium]|jgi:hypothetical protein
MLIIGVRVGCAEHQRGDIPKIFGAREQDSRTPKTLTTYLGLL